MCKVTLHNLDCIKEVTLKEKTTNILSEIPINKPMNLYKISYHIKIKYNKRLITSNVLSK